ncbi:MAG: glutamine--tRNA ligase/YqeY domain fusion protein [Bacillota bacterium]|nr:glutamine--tRNA ligase/YqeY domain fusion protein [Bacillota bacterium]
MEPQINEEIQKPSNFIHEIIDQEIENGKYEGKRIHTRFPPEPNGYLHIGHAKAICIDFGTAEKYGGKCNLRFDDTNPSKEDVEYVESIKEDVKWLGFNWDGLFYASEYFETMYDCAIRLIKKGMAFVCDLNADQIREYRGTLTEPGKESPYRNRSVEENLDLFERMKAGEFADGSRVLRAKIDMASPNINMRDPVIYRILRASHHRTGDKWCIYPMYDFAHPIEDIVEGITHSLCSLEFEDHRPLYDWVVNNVDLESKPRQIEFARLNITYTMMSKRKLLALVKEGYVSGWNDPRMPTLSGLRRRGYTPWSIRNFCERIGVAKTASTVDIALLEHCIREDLNKSAHRVMAVLRPLKVVIDNYPDNQSEEFEAENNPEDPNAGFRKVPFSKVLYIEQDDFMEEPPKNYFRMSPGREVRLKNAYFIKCDKVVKDEATGEIIELHCSYDPETKGGNAPDGRKVKGTIHWVSAAHCVDAEVRLYDNLFTNPNPSEEKDGLEFKDYLNSSSLEVLRDCKVEPSLVNAPAGSKYQFLRMGYFCVDSVDSKEGVPVFNRTVGLKDTWAKLSSSERAKTT